MSDLNIDEKLVLEIANNPNFRSKKIPGRILWNLAFADHPEFREHFPHKDKAKRILNDLQVRGLYSATSDLSEEEKLVLQIATKYVKASGVLDWKSAYAENPDARAKLSYGPKDPKGQKGMNIASNLRKRGLLPENKLSLSMKANRHAGAVKTPPKPRKVHLPGVATPGTVDINELIQQRVEAIIQDNRFCPRCSRNIEQNLRMSLMSDKLQQLPINGSNGL